MTHTAASCLEKAVQFRRMAEAADEHTAATLIAMAEEYEEEARRLEPDAEPPLPAT